MHVQCCDLKVVSRWTRIPVTTLDQGEEKLAHLIDRLHERVVGQNEAVNLVAQAVLINLINRYVLSSFWARSALERQSLPKHLPRTHLTTRRCEFALTCPSMLIVERCRISLEDLEGITRTLFAYVFLFGTSSSCLTSWFHLLKL